MTEIPSEIAPILGEIYWIWKDAEAEKEVLRKQFFDAVTEAARNGKLAQKTVLLPADIETMDDMQEYAEQYNAGWLVIDTDDDGHVLLEEDPSLKGGVEVVILDEDIEDRKGKKHPGYVVSKTIVGGSVLVDDSRMMRIDPDLYDVVTQWKGFPGIDSHSNPALDYELEQMDWPREIRSDLDEDDIESIKPYSYEGSRSVKLNVRYAKPDESPGG